MIALARFQRSARRPNLTSVQRNGKRSDASLAREIERRAESGRIVRVFSGMKALFEVIPNGDAWLVRSVFLDGGEVVGTFPSTADALRGGDVWAARRRSCECDEEEFLGGDDPRPAA